ncbi:unnamed protein product [Microthlaspi erraticum]|uniref:Retrotransposon gag domain-containing protein n=1 Tax=Microthlaspi erraticum TaxID=1685480 RepID=A0A6D2JF09_9BRAS|nr:unnamed protein product [Microthlaspi erraticum]
MDIPEGNGNPLGNGNGRARQTRPIGLEMHQTAINKDKGLSHHLSRTTTLRSSWINGVSEDAIKLRLFPMSLADKAHQWEKSLPHGTITTWDECKKAFLAKFFSTGRTAKLRSEISGFTQRNNETFGEACDRFKGYTSQCPHNFNNESLLSTLYRGCLARYRDMLDTANNGNFLNQDVDDGWQLVENIANSNGSYGEEYDRTDWKLDRPLDRVGCTASQRHACPQFQVGQTDPSTIHCEACLLCFWQLQKDLIWSYTIPTACIISDCSAWLQTRRDSSRLPTKFSGATSECTTWIRPNAISYLTKSSLGYEYSSSFYKGKPRIIESSSASSSSSQEYAQAVTLRSGRQLPNREVHLKSAVDIDDEEGEDLVEYSDIPAPTRSS